MTVAQSTTPDQLSAENDDEDEEVFTKDDIFHVLQNERRRNVLRHLDGIEGKTEMRDVAEQVAAWEHDTTLRALKSDERQRVYIALYQSHLPKLDKLDVINYDQSRGIVEPRPRLDDLTEYLDQEEAEVDDEVDDDDGSFAPYYLGASGVGAVVFGLALANVSVFGGVPTAVAGGVALLALALLSVVHLGREQL